MEWPNEVIFEFLKLYKVEPTLWNTRSPEHKNQKDLYDAWYRIKSKLMDGNIAIKEIKKKRDHLMATYRKARSKVIDSKMAGKPGSHAHKPDWPFYEEMSKFLDDIYTPRKIKNAKGNHQVTSKQRKKSTLEKKGVDTAAEPVSTEEDDCAAFCTNLKVQMRFLEVEQKYICQKLISDAIFLARTCQLNLTSRIHTEIGASDRIPSTSNSSFQIQFVPDSSTLRNERSSIPSTVQRTVSVPATLQGYSYDDPLRESYSEDVNPQDSDSEDTKEGIIISSS